MINKSVLVIERDPEEAERIISFFRRNSFRNKIDIVGSKSEALDYIFHTGSYSARGDEETPGLILLDLQTNRTPEAKILKPLQHYLRTQKIPIVILTSSPEQERDLNDYHLGAVGFIRKPLDFTHFIEVIQMMGMNWREHPSAAS